MSCSRIVQNEKKNPHKKKNVIQRCHPKVSMVRQIRRQTHWWEPLVPVLPHIIINRNEQAHLRDSPAVMAFTIFSLNGMKMVVELSHSFWHQKCSSWMRGSSSGEQPVATYMYIYSQHQIVYIYSQHQIVYILTASNHDCTTYNVPACISRCLTLIGRVLAGQA